MLKIFLDEETDFWEWIIWAVANQNAAEAVRIKKEVPLVDIVRYYAMDSYHNSYRVKTKKRSRHI